MRAFLTIVNGVRTLINAIIVSGGSGDADKIIATNAAGKLDVTFLPDGIGPDATTRTASEAISAGAIVSISASGGVRNADATTAGREVHAFAQSAIGNGASGEIRFDGTITGLSGLTEGATYFLSETAGEITITPVTGSGKIHQVVGVALSATSLSFQPGEPVVMV